MTFGSVVFVEIDLGCVASGAFAVIRYITLPAAAYGFYGLVVILVTPFKVFHEVAVIPRFYMEYQRELIYLKLLIFWRMGIIIGPLFEGDVLTDKVYQPDILLIELLDDLK